MGGVVEQVLKPPEVNKNDILSLRRPFGPRDTKSKAVKGTVEMNETFFASQANRVLGLVSQDAAAFNASHTTRHEPSPLISNECSWTCSRAFDCRERRVPGTSQVLQTPNLVATGSGGGPILDNGRDDAPSLPEWRNRDDNRMVAEREFERIDFGQRLDRLDANCRIINLYRRVRDTKTDRHVVLARQAFPPDD